MSSLFNLKPPAKGKPASKHPWQSTIKDTLSHRIKHAHNSVRNPCYPKIKEKIPDADRVRFTVIGDRVTKEYIYCVNLVNGLHKYRWKKFDVPSIRGVSTVEWEEVWGSLKVQYGGFAHCLNSKVAILIDNKFLGGEKELKQLVETKYIYHIVLDYCNEAVANFASYIRCSGRPCAFMHIAINDEHIGTLIFMLYADLVPYTCENFLRLCRDTKGGYSGTPIHRIVKDGWIQCGGFGLKSTELDCENFMVPHDRRGVLCMANDGRHVDCSTQFFVLLQPAPWMAHKYVAFGQLIEGDATLKKIENVPTWYESPMSNITIYKAGIFNMECQDIMINRGANEYIAGHIEDLNALGDLLIELLVERVFLEIELKIVERLTQELLGESEETTDDTAGHLHATQRFRRKKEDIEKQIHSQSMSTTLQNLNLKSQTAQSHKKETQSGSPSKSRPQSAKSQPSKAKTLAQTQSAKSQMTQSQSQKSQMGANESENNEFDVEEYELEETDYKHESLLSTLSLIIKPERPYYIPLTDVPYPGEIDSIYDLKKFVKGHYCLESDLDVDVPKKAVPKTVKQFPSELLTYFQDEPISESESSESLDSEDEREITQYLKGHADRVSFAGGVIKTIRRGMAMSNVLKDTKKSDMISWLNDDQLRRLRLASMDIKSREAQDKKVSISLPNTTKSVTNKIKRRQTGFVRPEDLEKIHIFKTEDQDEIDDDEPDIFIDDDELGHRKVRIAPSAISATGAPPRPLRRPTGFVRASEFGSDMDVPRQSVLQRLYQDVSYDDEQGPTLKDYKPIGELRQKSILLTTTSPTSRIRSDDDTRERFLRHSLTVEDASFANVMNLQHSKKIARKISSDYVKTIDQIEHKTENSLRTVEFAKSRPSMRVSEYQLKNQKYSQEAGVRPSALTMRMKSITSQAQMDRKKKKRDGLRLPGDTPLYSMVDMAESTKSRLIYW